MPLPLLRAHNSIRTYPCIGYYLAFLKHLLQARGESPGRKSRGGGEGMEVARSPRAREKPAALPPHILCTNTLTAQGVQTLP